MPARRPAAPAPPPGPGPGRLGALTPQRIADRLHRTVCQSLTGARFLVGGIELQLPPESADELKKQLRKVEAALDESSRSLRDLIQELRCEPRR